MEFPHSFLAWSSLRILVAGERWTVYRRIFWKRLHVWIKSSHRLPNVKWRILRSKRIILRSRTPSEHPVFLRRHFAWKPVVVSRFGGCFLKLFSDNPIGFIVKRPLRRFNNKQQQQILLKIGKKLITLLSHPQIAYGLIEAGGAEDILQNKIYI